MFDRAIPAIPPNSFSPFLFYPIYIYTFYFILSFNAACRATRRKRLHSLTGQQRQLLQLPILRYVEPRAALPFVLLDHGPARLILNFVNKRGWRRCIAHRRSPRHLVRLRMIQSRNVRRRKCQVNLRLNTRTTDNLTTYFYQSDQNGRFLKKNKKKKNVMQEKKMFIFSI